MKVLICIPCPDKQDYCPQFFRTDSGWIIEDDHGNIAPVNASDFAATLAWFKTQTAVTEKQYVTIFESGQLPTGVEIDQTADHDKRIDLFGARMSIEQLAAFAVEVQAGNFRPDVVEGKIVAAATA